ncbi:MAG: L,D-transpeptidase [Rhizobiales bacterium]|nr:L,D-transpeptidase [Hyphomicrobiales bacterium]
MSSKLTTLLAAFLVSTSIAATSIEASAAAKNPETQQAAETAGFKRGKVVSFVTKYPAGSIVVKTGERALYYVLGNGKAVRYAIAAPKKGFEWSGSHMVSQKVKWPDWSPPAAMRKRRPELPTYMAGGPENPLGARAIYLGSSLYRIHGTNEPSSIGKAASSGCIRMLNADVSELYAHVKMGALVVVV